VISGFALRRIGGRVGLAVLCVDSVVGLGIAALTWVHSTAVGSALMALVGMLAGMVQIALFSWVQRRVPQAYMGRTMSLLMFTFLGLSPVAASAAGVMLKYVGLGPLFVSAGFTLSAVALLCLTRPTLRAITIQAAPARA